jgi:hypothetical protein
MYLGSLLVKENISGPFMIVTDEESMNAWKNSLRSCRLPFECANELFANNPEFEERILRYRLDRIKSLPANHEERDLSQICVVLITDALLKKTKWLRGSNSWKWKVVILDNAHKLPTLDKESSSTFYLHREQFIVVTEQKDYANFDFGELGNLYAFVDSKRFENHVVMTDKIKESYISVLQQITVPKQKALVNNL